MSEQTRPFELVEFEQVDAARGTALLRIVARPSAAAQAGPWTLVLTSARQVHRHEQLRAIPGPPGMMRAAFSAPAQQCALGARFALEFSDGSTLQLPAPSHRSASPASRPTPEEIPGGPQSQDARSLEAERRAESRRLAVVELERRLQAEAELRTAAETDLAQLRADRDAARGEREIAIADRDKAFADRVAELERANAAAELAHARAHASRRELTALDEQLAHAQAHATVLEEALAARTGELDDLTAQSRQQALAAEAQATAAEERATAMEEQIESLRELARRTRTQHAVELQTSESKLDVAHAEGEVAHAELKALKSQNERLESTITAVDRAFAVREAEIDLLHDTVVESRTVERDVSESVRRLADEEVARRLADARSEASTALIAEIEVLRLQLRGLQEQAHTLKQTAEESARRALAAEGELAKRSRQPDELSTERTRSQATAQELRRVRDAAALVAAELMNASDAVTQARAEAATHRQRAEELQRALSSAQQTVDETRETAAVHASENQRLSASLKSEVRRRERAEDELLDAAAERVLEKDFFAIEKQAREEALFSRLAEAQTRASAAIDAARERH